LTNTGATPAGETAHGTPPHGDRLVLAAFAAVYVIWGSTYLAIRVAVETLPPFLMAGTRFSCAGVILYALLRARGAPRPRAIDWRRATVAGLLMLTGGNGLVTWAETGVPSNVAALLVAGTPCFIVLLDWAHARGTRPSWPAIAGVFLGLAGMVLMVGAGPDQLGGARPAGIAALLAASLAWAAGTLYARHRPGPGHRALASAQQMIAGGAAQLVVALALGESPRASLAAASCRGVLALAYLSLFGSVVAFSAYGFLVRSTTPVKLSTVAYVNPVIAVILGWALLGEALGPRVLAGAAIIVVGVAVMTRSANRRA
jgi:drug/metabolite transporter (DMT)-like permease